MIVRTLQAMSADILRRLKGSISEVAEDLQLKIHIAVLKHEWQIGQVSTNHITPFSTCSVCIDSCFREKNGYFIFIFN